MWLTFCEGISYSDDDRAEAQSACSRSLARSDQAAKRKPAGTERQVEPTTGAQFQVPQIRIFSAPAQVSPCGFSRPSSPSALAFARALEVLDQLRELVVFGIEVGHREVENLRQSLQGL